MQINLMFTQESFEKGSLEVTDDELFYPDCNMSKIMRVENGKIKIKREWKKVKIMQIYYMYYILYHNYLDHF